MSRLKLPLGKQLRDPTPDDATLGRMWSEVRKRSGAPRRRVVWLVPSLAGAAACALLIWLVVRPQAGPLKLADGSPLPQTLAAAVLDDGSTLSGQSASFAVRENTRERFAVKMLAGRAEVTVRPGKREWTLDTGKVVLRTRGGRFVVALSAERTEVQVIEGEIMLDDAPLKAGEQRSIELTPPTAPVAPAPVPDPAPTKAEVTPPPAAPTWRDLAARRKYREAYEALKPEGIAPPSKARVSLDELIGRADVARLSGHASEAVPILQRIVDEHPEDRRAALAAFTKGRIHFDQLDQPREAARAFEAALTLGLPQPLGEDAHARAVEAWLKAGDRGSAEAAAQRYQTQFPGGQHRERIQRWLSGK